MLYCGDCLVESERIESGSVDLILTDPPFGNMQGQCKTGIYHQGKERHEWDKIIPPDKIMEISDRILRKNGRLILFAQSDFVFILHNAAIPNLPYSYKMTWEKDSIGSFMRSKKAPLYQSEDILVFSKNHDYECTHTLRQYFKKVLDHIGLNLKQINVKLGHRKAEHTFYVQPKKAIIKEKGQKADHCLRYGSTQFSLCTEATYQELIDVFEINKMPEFKLFEELKEIDNQFKNEYPSTFNLWQGGKYKSNILKYKKDYNGFHPTQKPIALLEDLIKTFSNAGDTICDLTMGSGSTGVAAAHTDRKFIGIEKEQKYFDIAKKRIAEAKQKII